MKKFLLKLPWNGVEAVKTLKNTFKLIIELATIW